jgi:dolichyl-phosphate beta-glucosyltransferase
MKDIFLSVVIPAFNEEKSLPETLNSVLGYLKKQNYSWEVIVSNDGSLDHTRDLVLEFQKSFPELILVDSQINHGKGLAVKNGALQSQGELVLFMDADNSTKINEIEKAFPLLALDGSRSALNAADIVIASRRLKDSKIIESQPIHRRLLGEFFRIFVKVVFGLAYDDTQAGFKVFSRKAKKVFELQTLSSFGFDVELLFLAKKLGLKTKEIPIQWKNSANSHVSLKKMVQAMVDLIKLRFRRYTLNRV